MLAHPVDEALAHFTLIGGSTGDGKTTACAMSLLNWIWRNGDEWSDAPECAHPLIRHAVIAANDGTGTTAEMRAELVRAGEAGVLDTWWVPSEVVAASLAASKLADAPSRYDRALLCLQRVAAWKASPTRERPYLVGANLARANLADAYLAGADLADADLAGAYLAGADLADADLARANLAHAYLAGANLAHAYLAGANLAGADLAGANLTRANLTGANLVGAYLTGANLAGANLAGANLTRANLTGANLVGAYLVGANLADADLARANLARANLADADLARANLAHAYLAGAYLTGANLAGAYLVRARGNSFTVLPTGWKVNDAGLVVRDAD